MKTALITGASGTIGGAIAAHLRHSGYRTITPTRAWMDMGSGASISKFMAGLGTVDLVVVAHGTLGTVGDALASDPGEWERAITVNLLGTMRLIRCAKGRPDFIVLAGGGGLQDATPSLSSYACSKAALVSLVRTLAAEGVHINAIFPGMQISSIHDPIIAAGREAAPEQFDKVMRLRHFGTGAVPVEKTLTLMDRLLQSSESGEIHFAKEVQHVMAAVA